MGNTSCLLVCPLLGLKGFLTHYWDFSECCTWTYSMTKVILGGHRSRTINCSFLGWGSSLLAWHTPLNSLTYSPYFLPLITCIFNPWRDVYVWLFSLSWVLIFLMVPLTAINWFLGGITHSQMPLSWNKKVSQEVNTLIFCYVNHKENLPQKSIVWCTTLMGTGSAMF